MSPEVATERGHWQLGQARWQRIVEHGTETAESPLPHFGTRPGDIQVTVLTGGPGRHFSRLSHLSHRGDTSGQLLRLAMAKHFVCTGCGSEAHHIHRVWYDARFSALSQPSLSSRSDTWSYFLRSKTVLVP